MVSSGNTLSKEERGVAEALLTSIGGETFAAGGWQPIVSAATRRLLARAARGLFISSLFEVRRADHSAARWSDQGFDGAGSRFSRLRGLYQEMPCQNS
jgi:hypothetical protein